MSHESKMELFQHRFDDIEDYLHHRPPYLMVDRIVSILPTEIETEKVVTGEEFFLAGHFPGAPVVPGAMLQELATQSAGALIAAYYNPMEKYDTHDPQVNRFALGVLVKVKHARYKGFARPLDRLAANVILNDMVLNETVGGVFDFSASIRLGEKPIARLAFQLTNIESAALSGGR